MGMCLAQWLQTLSSDFGFPCGVQWLGVRGLGGALRGALPSLLVGPRAGPAVIPRLTALKIGQPVRGYAMETHLVKSGTPTMGGGVPVFFFLSPALGLLFVRFFL